MTSFALRAIGDLVRQQKILGDLLGDGRGTDQPPALANILDALVSAVARMPLKSTPQWE